MCSGSLKADSPKIAASVLHFERRGQWEVLHIHHEAHCNGMPSERTAHVRHEYYKPDLQQCDIHIVQRPDQRAKRSRILLFISQLLSLLHRQFGPSTVFQISTSLLSTRRRKGQPTYDGTEYLAIQHAGHLKLPGRSVPPHVAHKVEARRGNP